MEPQELGSFCGEGLGPFGTICSLFSGRTDAGNPASLNAIASVISTIIGLITIIAALFFMMQFVIGGLNWISSSGDKQRLQEAQGRISQGIIGLIVVVAAYGVMTIISTVLGFDFLDPGSFITNLLI
ncbi:hypothetical protein C4579_01405 [Candidatus Microgenomates bacterium]|nr:MAG: hypothetical protein C4579_01405 [Candidatus Microgenomates bacterium]